MRYFIEMAYNGAGYNGWQIQPNDPSIQNEVNIALCTLLQTSVEVVGAGRTDTGVHASFFVAHFDIDHEIDPDRLTFKMNRFLSKHIAINRIYRVSDDLHARFSALSRTYKYYIDKTKNPFTYPYTFRPSPMPDINKMNAACPILFEFSDFTSFSKLHTDVKTNECTILEAHWDETDTQLIFTVKANRFLRNMVRAIVGTMIEIGQGKLSNDDLRAIIKAKDRCKAGASVPGNALFLCDIQYTKNE